MSTTTPNLGLFKYNTSTDANSAFNINTALNNNWDIIDTALTNVDALPDQTGKDGYILTTNGSEASWGETDEIYPVIEAYQEGNSWYRVYSDGWCEQGGYVTGAGCQVALSKSYSNTNYTILLSPSSTNFNNTATWYNKAVDSFYISQTSSEYSSNWQTAGYIEV